MHMRIYKDTWHVLPHNLLPTTLSINSMTGGLDQLADRSLRMREVRGSKPRFSILEGLLSVSSSFAPPTLYQVCASLCRSPTNNEPVILLLDRILYAGRDTHTVYAQRRSRIFFSACGTPLGAGVRCFCFPVGRVRFSVYLPGRCRSANMTERARRGVAE